MQPLQHLLQLRVLNSVKRSSELAEPSNFREIPVLAPTERSKRRTTLTMANKREKPTMPYNNNSQLSWFPTRNIFSVDTDIDNASGLLLLGLLFCFDRENMYIRNVA
jgi:hypothetical protein